MEISSNIFIRQDDMKGYKYEEQKPENYRDIQIKDVIKKKKNDYFKEIKMPISKLYKN